MKRKILTVPTLVTGVALIGLAACEQAPPTAVDAGAVAPERADAVFAAGLGQNDGAVTVPVTLRLATSWNVPGASAADCPDLIDPETGELFTATGTGEGQANHLGRVRITAEHPTINLCSVLEDPPVPPAPGDVARTGQFELVAADGSALTGSYHFLLVPPELGGFMTMIVGEGTHRFQGASGQLELSWEQSGDLECPDIVCLADVILDPAVFEGSLAVPRP